jgi:hypothetical protein
VACTNSATGKHHCVLSLFVCLSLLKQVFLKMGSIKSWPTSSITTPSVYYLYFKSEPVDSASLLLSVGHCPHSHPPLHSHLPSHSWFSPTLTFSPALAFSPTLTFSPDFAITKPFLHAGALGNMDLCLVYQVLHEVLDYCMWWTHKSTRGTWQVHILFKPITVFHRLLNMISQPNWSPSMVLNPLSSSHTCPFMYCMHHNQILFW